MDDSQPALKIISGTLLLFALALSAAPARAQLALQAFQIVINRSGENCKTIETTQPIGTSSGGDTLVAVACANGGRHVVRIHQDNSVSYMTLCDEFKTRTGIRCFDDK
ncbi:hypothetical protein [Thiocystis violascens]|uniref:Uncharacterized protein n=1 Tax=Thiocystis violascens (strain ATCC 17096 / DSM 198 / 6111) TaxID=765911 RepID=I3YF60_THIV6|nr:hypothetical protein [Thiocystis violascens]AFL75628.1 hypothetical protein Thivi_3784 [Thiocystis violascens DSM 198]